MQNNRTDSVEIAKMMVRRHGSQALAVAQERENEARLESNSERLDHWQTVQRVISELRSTAITATR